jgi:hypothetical protein
MDLYYELIEEGTIRNTALFNGFSHDHLDIFIYCRIRASSKSNLEEGLGSFRQSTSLIPVQWVAAMGETGCTCGVSQFRKRRPNAIGGLSLSINGPAVSLADALTICVIPYLHAT